MTGSGRGRIALWLSMLCGLAGTAGAQSVPRFEVEPAWPRPLPNRWILGEIGGLAVDGRDHIWVYQRPRSLTDDEVSLALAEMTSLFEHGDIVQGIVHGICMLAAHAERPRTLHA